MSLYFDKEDVNNLKNGLIEAFGNPKADAEARQYQQNRELTQFKLEQERANAPVIAEGHKLTLEALKRKNKEEEDKGVTESEIGKILSGWEEPGSYDLPDDAVDEDGVVNTDQDWDSLFKRGKKHDPMFAHDKDGGVYMTDEGRANIPKYIALYAKLHGAKAAQEAYDFMNRTGIPLGGTAYMTPAAAVVGRASGPAPGIAAGASNPTIGLTKQQKTNSFDSSLFGSWLSSLFGNTPPATAGTTEGKFSPSVLRSAGAPTPQAVEAAKKEGGLDAQPAPGTGTGPILDTSGINNAPAPKQSGSPGDVGPKGDAGSEGPIPTGTPSSSPAESGPDENGISSTIAGFTPSTPLNSSEAKIQDAKIKAAMKATPVLKKGENGVHTWVLPDIVTEGIQAQDNLADAQRREKMARDEIARRDSISKDTEEWAFKTAPTALIGRLSIDSTDRSNRLPEDIAAYLAKYAGIIRQQNMELHGMPALEAGEDAINKVAKLFSDQYVMNHESFGGPKIEVKGASGLWPENKVGMVTSDADLTRKLQAAASSIPELVITSNGTAAVDQSQALAHREKYILDHPGLTEAQRKLVENDQQLRSYIEKLGHYTDSVNKGREISPAMNGLPRRIVQLDQNAIDQRNIEIQKLKAAINKKLGL